MSSLPNSTAGNLFCGTGSTEDITCIELGYVVVFLMALLWFGITCGCDIIRNGNTIEEEDEIAMKSLIGKVNDAIYV